MKRSIILIAIVFVLLIGLSVSGEAADFIISPNHPTIVLGNDGKKFKAMPGDLIEYYAETGTAMLIFDGDNFAKVDKVVDIKVDKAVDNIDAYADNLGYDVQGNALLLISTADDAKLGDVNFKGGDLVKVAYNYSTHQVVWAEIFLGHEMFSSGNENVDALWYLPPTATDNEKVVLSTTNEATLGELTFKNGDLVMYDPAKELATLVFSEALFSDNENIDAVMYSPGSIILSTTNEATLGGCTFQDGDVVKYDPYKDIATLVFSEKDFKGTGNLDVVAVAPIPGAIWLLGSGIAGLAGLRIRKKKYTPSRLTV
ncbi:MAG: VPLPA-CTERM sorting domain-containing protein [Thermodesulfobacteriota bacterium]|nr:VPLPA-CTERM sorting domain-containing protein [Thermodesulfobacteriota bacterium]